MLEVQGASCPYTAACTFSIPSSPSYLKLDLALLIPTSRYHIGETFICYADWKVFTFTSSFSDCLWADYQLCMHR